MACCIFGNLPYHNCICKWTLGSASVSSMIYKRLQLYFFEVGAVGSTGISNWEGPKQDPLFEEKEWEYINVVIY